MLQVSWLAILLILIPVTKAVVPERVKFKAFTSKQLQMNKIFAKIVTTVSLSRMDLILKSKEHRG